MGRVGGVRVIPTTSPVKVVPMKFEARMQVSLQAGQFVLVDVVPFNDVAAGVHREHIEQRA